MVSLHFILFYARVVYIISYPICFCLILSDTKLILSYPIPPYPIILLPYPFLSYHIYLIPYNIIWSSLSLSYSARCRLIMFSHLTCAVLSLNIRCSVLCSILWSSKQENQLMRRAKNIKAMRGGRLLWVSVGSSVCLYLFQGRVNSPQHFSIFPRSSSASCMDSLILSINLSMLSNFSVQSFTHNYDS